MGIGREYPFFLSILLFHVVDRMNSSLVERRNRYRGDMKRSKFYRVYGRR